MRQLPQENQGSINDYAFLSSSHSLGYYLLLPGLGTRLYFAMISDVNRSIAMCTCTCTYPHNTDCDSPVYRICLCLRWISDVWIIQQVLYSLQNLKTVNCMSLNLMASLRSMQVSCTDSEYQGGFHLEMISIQINLPTIISHPPPPPKIIERMLG